MTTTLLRCYVSFLLVCCGGISLIAQTNISGVINQYSAVTAVDYPGNSLTVLDPGSFATGDQVLIIQMQGATIAEANNNSFGDISALGGAGNYELATVCNVNGNIITLENELVNTDYSASGQLQLVTVPSYTDATVSGTLTGQAWDGATGGIVALSVQNNLTLNAPINMDGKGFRGGAYENNLSDCVFFINVDNYFYPGPMNGGGKKGESIAAYISNKNYGRGAQAAGGGGGNDHNSGGGGGANAGAGGVGGEDLSTGTFNCDGEFPGIGGKVPALSANRIFLGSGGGAGDGNNLVGTSGGNGGGIILVFTNTLTIGTSATITANGIPAENTTGGDGAGGGGAGGSIYLQAAVVAGTPVLSTVGGNGGDVNNQGANRCFGPGGGGGGGLIRTNVSLPAGSLLVNGGSAGESLNTSAAGCTGNTGSAAGGNGIVLNEVAPSGTTLSAACSSLPVSWRAIGLTLRDKATLVSWSVGEQIDNDYFAVERSLDGQTFHELGRVAANQATEYLFTDAEPAAGTSFYRIKQTDFDLRQSYSSVAVSRRARTDVKLYPTLAQAGQLVRLELPDDLQQDQVTLSLLDQAGRRIFEKTPTGNQVIEVETTGLPAGLYFVRLRSARVHWTGRMVIGK